jgi:hypothetical protein
MLERKYWPCTVLYIIGIAGLVCSGLALVGVTWLVDIWPERILFDVFYGSLAGSVAAFALGCIAEVGMTVARTPDPRNLRTSEPADATVSPAHIESEPQQIPRAA